MRRLIRLNDLFGLADVNFFPVFMKSFYHIFIGDYTIRVYIEITKENSKEIIPESHEFSEIESYAEKFIVIYSVTGAIPLDQCY